MKKYTELLKTIADTTFEVVVFTAAVIIIHHYI